MMKFCNDNPGFMSAVTAIVGVLVSMIAIIISVKVSRKQSKISLFQERYKSYFYISEFVDRWLFYLENKHNMTKFQICRYGLANHYLFQELLDKDMPMEEVLGIPMLLKLTPYYNQSITELDKAEILFKNGRKLKKLRECYCDVWKLANGLSQSEGMENDEMQLFLAELIEVYEKVLKKMQKEIKLA